LFLKPETCSLLFGASSFHDVAFSTFVTGYKGKQTFLFIVGLY